MRKCSLYFCLILLWINVLSISAVSKDICEKCLKIENCGMFVFMDKDEQKKWSEVASCQAPRKENESGPFGFSPTAKGDYVCCPNSNLWGTDILSKINNTLNSNDNNGRIEKLDPAQVKPGTGNGRINIRDPGNQLQFPIDNQYQPKNPNVNQGLYNDGNYHKPNDGTPGYDFGPDQGVYSPDPGQQGYQNIYGNHPRRPNDKGVFSPQPNPTDTQYPDERDTNNQGSYYPNSPNYPRNRNPGYDNPYGGANLENKCAARTGLLPDARTGCCGKDESDTNTITDLQNLLNMNTQSNQNNYRPRQPNTQRYPNRPYYGQRVRRFADNETDFMLDDRIAGGKETELDQFPWTVLLRLTFDYGNKRAAYNCGGSLISPKYILTAGHCVFEKGARVVDIEVTLAEYDKRTFPRDCIASLGQRKICVDNVLMHAENVILHRDYDDDHLHNDIALIRLRGYAPFTRFIRPICLPPINIDINDFANLPLAVAGWGRNGDYNSDIKQSTVVRLISHSECKESYPSLSDAQLCAVGRTGEDTCKGDSGGPLMMLFRGSYYIVGVVSGKRADSPCGTRVPSLYTNVYDYVPWITRHIAN